MNRRRIGRFRSNENENSALHQTTNKHSPRIRALTTLMPQRHHRHPFFFHSHRAMIKTLNTIAMTTTACLAWTPLAATAQTAPESQDDKRPNILFIMSDDHATTAMGCYGLRLAALNPTPVLDSLAQNGMVFDQVFCANSICAPSRATILTGQYSHVNGVLGFDTGLATEQQYLPSELSKLGYQTAVVGKWHLIMEPGAFDYYNVLRGQGDYFKPWFANSERDLPFDQQIGSGKFGERLGKEVTVERTEGHSADVITDISLAWLKQRDHRKPFFLMHHFKSPHGIWKNAPRYDTYLADVEIPEPDNLYDQPAEGFGSVATRGENDALIHQIGSSVSRRNTRRRNMGQLLNMESELDDHTHTHAVYQAYLKRYLRCVKGVDDNIQRLLDYLRETGELDNTLIIYTSDQGMMLGEHDYEDKRWIYEESMRMPFIVHWPGEIQAGRRSDLLINNTDFAPTLIELAGGQAPEYMQGHSFAKTLRGVEQGQWRNGTYYRYWLHMSNAVPAHFGVRTDRYKLIFYYAQHFQGNATSTPVAWELYDLQEDPQEMHNLYGQPGMKAITAELKTLLRELRDEVGENDSENYPEIQSVIDAHWD